jgi:hypothetical protein
MMGSRMVEADDPTNGSGGCTAAAKSQNLVSVTYQLASYVEKGCGGNPRFADESMPYAMRHERELPSPQELRIRSLDFEPALAERDNVEHHAALERRQRERPRCRELGTAVIDPAHAHEVKRLTERINRPPEIIHADIIAIMSDPTKDLDE